jgi:hypothetical protein
MLTFIAEKLTPKPDFWIWTGDNPPRTSLSVRLHTKAKAERKRKLAY